MNLADELEKGSLEEHLKQISAAGYDYVETSAAGLKPLTSLQLEEIKNALAGNGLYCPRANCFFPASPRFCLPLYRGSVTIGIFMALLPGPPNIFPMYCRW